jgi:hypothetical protein
MQDFTELLSVPPGRRIRVPPIPFKPKKCNSSVMHHTDNLQPSQFLVRHVALNKFLTPAGRWVRRAEKACNFPNLLNAINTCLGRGLKNVELIMRFEGNKPDHCIRLDAIE